MKPKPNVTVIIRVIHERYFEVPLIVDNYEKTINRSDQMFLVSIAASKIINDAQCVEDVGKEIDTDEHWDWEVDGHRPKESKQ